MAENLLKCLEPLASGAKGCGFNSRRAHHFKIQVCFENIEWNQGLSGKSRFPTGFVIVVYKWVKSPLNQNRNQNKPNWTEGTGIFGSGFAFFVRGELIWLEGRECAREGMAHGMSLAPDYFMAIRSG